MSTEITAIATAISLTILVLEQIYYFYRKNKQNDKNNSNI